MGSDAKIVNTSNTPVILVEDAELLFSGEYTRAGFDLIIIGADGQQLVIADYFAFNPPPNLMLPNGTGLSFEMVKALLHEPLVDTLFAGPATSNAAAEDVGTVRFAYGKVFRIDGDKNKIPLKKGDTVFEGDEIIVEGRGYVRATMNDGTRFNLGANSRAILDNYEFNEAAKIGNFEATVLRGGFHYESGKIGGFGTGRDHSRIKTPSALIGIRGSALDGTVQDDGSTIVVHQSGILTITDISGNDPVTLTFPGNTSVILVSGRPTFINQATPEQVQQLEAALPPPPSPGEEQEGEETTGEETQQTEGDGDEGGNQAGDDDGGDDNNDAQDVLSNASDIEPSIDENADDPLGNPIPQDDPPPPEDPAAQAGADNVEVTLPPPPDPPPQDLPPVPTLALPDAFLVPENNGIDLIGVLDNDTGAGGEAVEIVSVTAENIAGNLVFIPEEQALFYVASSFDRLAPGESVNELFTYVISAGGQTSSTTVTLTVTGVNDAPIAAPDTSDQLDEGEVTALAVLANDTDVDNANLTVGSIVSVSSGIATISADGSTIVYTAPIDLAEGELRDIRIVYQASDGDLAAESFATLTVLGFNDPPIINPNADSPTPIALGNGPVLLDVLSIITDDSDDLEVVGLDLANTIGNVFLGSVYYDPEDRFAFLKAGETYVDTFGFTVRDTQGLTTTGNYSVIITGEADPPVAGDDEYIATEGEVLQVNAVNGVLANDLDPDGDSLTVLGVLTGPVSGSLSLDANGSFTYTPDDFFSGTDSFQYHVTDGADGTVTGTATIIVEESANHPPVADDVGLMLNENDLLNTNLFDNVVDPNQDPLSVAGFTQGGSPKALGDLTLSDFGANLFVDPVTGQLQFDPGTSRFHQALRTGESQVEEFVYTVDDGNGGSDTAIFRINVEGESLPDIDYRSNSGEVVVEDTLSIASNFEEAGEDLQGAAAVLERAERFSQDVVAIEDTGASDFVFGTDTATNIVELIGNPYQIERDQLSITENQWIADDDLPTITIEGLLTETFDLADSFQINVRAGESLILDIDGGDNFGLSDSLQLTVYESFSNGFITSVEDGGLEDRGSVSSVDPFLVFTATNTGTYTVVVSDDTLVDEFGVVLNSIGATADYTLQLSIATDAEHEFRYREATIIDETQIEATEQIADLPDQLDAAIMISRDDFKIGNNLLLGHPLDPPPVQDAFRMLPTLSILGDLSFTDRGDYFAVDLFTGDKLTIDVDMGRNAYDDLDTQIVVFEQGDPTRLLVESSNPDIDSGSDSSVDPYFTYTATQTTTYVFNVREEFGNLDSGSYVLHATLDTIVGSFETGRTVLNERDVQLPEFRPGDEAEVLSIQTQSGISALYGGDYIALLGHASPDEFSEVLRTLTYNNQLLKVEDDEVQRIEFYGIDHNGEFFLVSSRDIDTRENYIDLADSEGDDDLVELDQIGNEIFTFSNLIAGGDLNGDGFDDILAGDYDIPGVVFGSANNSLQGSPEQNITFFNDGNITPGSHFYDLQHIGDFNGDGFGDLSVRFEYSHLINGPKDKTYIIFGREDIGDAPIEVNTNGDVNNGLEIDRPISRLQSLGDINGDGFDDLLARQYATDVIIFGGPAAAFNLVTTDLTDPANLLTAATPDNQFLQVDTSNIDFPDGTILHFNENGGTADAYGLTGAGDVNGDGYDDLLINLSVGEYYNDDPNSISYVVYGRPTEAFLQHSDHMGTLDVDDVLLANEAHALIASNSEGQYKYSQAQAIGDVNGDGFADLAYNLVPFKYNSDPGQSGTYIIFGGPTLEDFAQDVFDGGLTVDELLDTDGSYGFRLSSEQLLEESNPDSVQLARVINVGDLNGDGFADLVVTPYISDEHGLYTPHTPVIGNPVVVFGGPQLSGFDQADVAIDRLGPDQGITILGANQGLFQEDFFHLSVGDFDGDGFGDFLGSAEILDTGVDNGSGYDLFSYGVQLFRGRNGGDPGTVNGTAGDDELTADGNIFRINAGAGDDTILYDPNQPVQVDGGGGSDQLRIIQSGTTLDLTDQQLFTSIEGIDLGNTNNVLIVDAMSIRAMNSHGDGLALVTGTPHNLLVFGTNSDSVVTTDNGWEQQADIMSGAFNFLHFTNNGVSLLIDDDIDTSDVIEGLGIDDQYLGFDFDNTSINITSITPLNNGNALPGTITHIDGQLLNPNGIGQAVATLASGAIVTLNVDGTSLEYDLNGAFPELVDETGHDQFTFTVESGGVTDVSTFFLSFNNPDFPNSSDPLVFDPGPNSPVYDPNNVDVGRIALFPDGVTLFDPDANFAGGYSGAVEIRSAYPGDAKGYFYIDAHDVDEDKGIFVTNTGDTLTISGPGNAVNLQTLRELLPSIFYVPSEEDPLMALAIETVFYQDSQGTSTFTHTVTVDANPIGLHMDAGGPLDWNNTANLFERGANIGIVPGITDDVNLLGFDPLEIHVTDPAAARNLFIDKSGFTLSVQDQLTIDNELRFYNGDYLIVDATAGNASIVTNLLQVGGNPAGGGTLKLYSDSGTASIIASDGIDIDTQLIVQANGGQAILDAPKFDFSNAGIEFISPGALIVRNSNGDGDPATTDLRADVGGGLIIGEDTNTLVFLDAQLNLVDDFVLASYNNASDEFNPIISPMVLFSGRTEFSGEHTFTNQRSDLVLDNFLLHEETTLHNEGVLEFEGEVLLSGQLINNNSVYLDGANVVFGQDYHSTYADLILKDNDSSIAAVSDDVTLNVGGYLGAWNASHTISANVTGPEFLDVSSSGDLTFANDEHLLNLSGAKVYVDAGSTLTIDGGDLVISSDTYFDIDPGGMLDITEATRVSNGGQTLTLDNDTLILDGFVVLGTQTVDSLANLGHLNGTLDGVTLDFKGEVEIDRDSTYIAHINNSDDIVDELIFDRVRLGGRLYPMLTNPGLAMRGDMFVLLSAMHMESSFAYMEPTIVDLTPGAVKLLNPVYDFTEGASSVAVEVIGVTLEAPNDGLDYRGTNAVDVMFGQDFSFDNFLDIGSGDIAFSQNASSAIFAVTSQDFGRVVGQQFGTNVLLVEVDSLNLVQLQGTQIENVATIEFGLPGVAQELFLDGEAIDATRDNAFGEFTILDDADPADGDRVVLFGNFEVVDHGDGGTSFAGEHGFLTVDPTLPVEVREEGGKTAFYGTYFEDTIFGTEQDDFLDGLNGSDELQAAGGNDTVRFDADDAIRNVDGGAGIDTLFAEDDFIDLTGMDNFTNFEKIEFDGQSGGLSLDFSDLFGGGNFLDPNAVDVFSNDPAFGDHQLLVIGEDVENASLNFEGVEVSPENASLADDLVASGVTRGTNTYVDGMEVIPFTKGDVTIFLDTLLFENSVLI